MTNTVVSSDDYVEKLKKTIPGDLTAIYLSFRMIVGNIYGFGSSGTALNVSTLHEYIHYLVIFMIPLTIIRIFYLYFISNVNKYISDCYYYRIILAMDDFA
jgi:hypothetical protein